MNSERYSRQILYRNLGPEGQARLLSSRIAIVGMGALGCVNANELARAGVGYIRMIDCGLVEVSNLHRQILYTEADAAGSVPKVFAAAERLGAANSEIELDPVFSELSSSNADELLGGVDLIVDATDNIETRYLINEYCVENQIPWVYGGAVESEGMSASFLPGGPCLSCLTGYSNTIGQPPGRTCNTVGVLNSLTAIVASVQVTEALKILTGSPDVRRDLLYIEIWNNEFTTLPLDKDPGCPVCGRHEYQYLGHSQAKE